MLVNMFIYFCNDEPFAVNIIPGACNLIIGILPLMHCSCVQDNTTKHHCVVSIIAVLDV